MNKTKCFHQIFSISTSFTTAKFSSATTVFTFRRRSNYFVFQVYIPSALIVMVAWTSFWMTPTAVPARSAICVTTVNRRFSLESPSRDQNTSAISIRRNLRIHKILILILCNFSKEKKVRQKILDYSNDDVGNEIEEVLYDLALSTSICLGF